MGKNLSGHATVDIRIVVHWPVSTYPDALHRKSKLLPPTNVSSTIKHQMENPKLSLTTIPDKAFN